jgi:hypothetical protein
MGLSFTIAAGPNQRSHSQVRVPRDSWPNFTVSDSKLPKTGGPGPRIYIPRNRLARLWPQAPGYLFVVSYQNPLKSKSCYDRRSVRKSVLEWSTHLGLKTRPLLLSDDCCFVDVGCSRWRQDRSIIYSSYWSLPAQSFTGPSPVGIITIF